MTRCSCGCRRRLGRNVASYEHLCDLIIDRAEFIRGQLKDLHDNAYTQHTSSVLQFGRGGEAPSPLEQGSMRAKRAWFRLAGRDFDTDKHTDGLEEVAQTIRGLEDKVRAAFRYDPDPEDPYLPA